MGIELSRIWNAFLRGQLIIFLLTLVVYAIMLTSFGLPFPLGLALGAGIAKFIPYVGPLFMWTTYGLVCYFQPSPPLGLHPIVYAIIVVGCAITVDSITDNLISPRIMAQALKVHPAAVLIAALIAVSLLGLIGVIVAAPVLATVKLFSGYVFRKMLDQEPWEGISASPRRSRSPVLSRIRKLLSRMYHRARREGITLFTHLRKRASEK